MDNEYLVKILNEKIASLNDELKKASSERDYLMGRLSLVGINSPTPEEGYIDSNKRNYKWTKMILNSLFMIDRLITTDDLYQEIYDNNVEIRTLKRNKRIASLSGAVNSLKNKGKIKYIEDNTGTRLYGLPKYFDAQGIPTEEYIKKMEENDHDPSRFLNKKITTADIIDTNVVNVSRSVQYSEHNEDDLPF